jgi:transposase
MKVTEPMHEDLAVLNGAEIHTHNHLPIAAAYCKRLSLVDTINELVPSQMEISPGLVVQAMVLDTLSGRTPLYRVKEFMKNQDIALLLGNTDNSITAESFNDINLGRSLDALFEAGPTRIISALGIKAVTKFALDTNIVSYDTTSTSLWGDYAMCEMAGPTKGPLITHGHSKDNQPQLKQFMTELLCVDRGVPIFSTTLDGNSSDKKSNNKVLTQISSLMAKHGLGPGAFVYVADSAMVTEYNLSSVGNNFFISRLPATYNECKAAVKKAVDSNQWVDIGRLAETPTKGGRPNATYKAFETSVILYNKEYRALVVHSSSHDKRRQKKLEKAIVTSEKQLKKQLNDFSIQYYCEADVKVAASQAEALSGNLHTVKATIHSIEVRKPGRPPSNGLSPTNTRYTLSWEVSMNNDAIESEKQLTGCFVLLTNVPIGANNEMDSKKFLLTYKGQYNVESDFAFLKDPIVVNDVFLKKPHRIDALGMILVISLMIYRLMERNMRAYLKKEKKEVIGWVNRKTDKPTSFMMTTAISGIMVVSIKGRRMLLGSLSERQLGYLEALGLTSNVFTDAFCMCQPVIDSKKPNNG